MARGCVFFFILFLQAVCVRPCFCVIAHLFACVHLCLCACAPVCLCVCVCVCACVFACGFVPGCVVYFREQCARMCVTFPLFKWI